MSENVKINIFEKDNTSPSGRSIDSTDIAFIPGFSSLINAKTNIPTLITSTREFDSTFGRSPRFLTSKDVSSEYAKYGFKVGDPDRAYVYAKELLFQGMPIVYANLKFATEKITIDSVKVNNPKDAPKTSNVSAVIENGKVVLTSTTDESNSIVKFEVETSVMVDPSEDNPVVTTTFDLASIESEFDGLEVLSYAVDEEDLDNDAIKSSITKLSDTQYEFTGTIEEEITLVINVEAKVTMKKIDRIELTFVTPAGSILDAFYGSEPVIKEMLNEDHIADKSVYSVKYITSGGYPSVVNNDATSCTSEFATEMLKAAAHRGDAVALIDYQLDRESSVYKVSKDSGSVYSKLQALFTGKSNTEFGTAMYPWGVYNCGSTLSSNPMVSMPASFGYLMCVAKAIKTSPNWLAMAGVTRGVVPGLTTLLVPDYNISNFVAEEMQPKFGVEDHSVSVNTITNVRPYGLTLWGNRTLKDVSKDGTVALNFLNIRNLLSDIKKLLYTTAKACMFEQNSTSLWLSFKGGIEPLLRRMKSGNGIQDYKIVRGTTKYNGDPLTKGEIAAVIRIYPMYAVEYFELAVEINDEDVTVL